MTLAYTTIACCWDSKARCRKRLPYVGQRLNAGWLSKVCHGEYVQHLPTGLVRLPDNCHETLDDQVRQVIELIFAKFAELGSCQKVLRFCKQQGVLLPRHQTSGFHKGELLWKKPSAATIYEIMGNPASTGAFVYGRRPRIPPARYPGTTRPAQSANHWPSGPTSNMMCIQPTSPGRSTRRTKPACTIMRCSTPNAHSQGGARRGGCGLVAGSATCGECGHLMRVVYKPGVAMSARLG